MEVNGRDSTESLAHRTTILSLSMLLLLLGLLLPACVFYVWQVVERAQVSTETPPAARLDLWGLNVTVTAEAAFFLFVLAASALGSFVHAATSFVSYVGNRDLKRSWALWYVFRTLIGSALATVAYLAFRAGFLGEGATKDVNAFGVGALAALVGLFSKQATDKLREVFDVVFRAGPGYGDGERADKLAPTPTAARLLPPTATKGAPGSVHVVGRSFPEGAVVHVGGEPRETTRLDEEVLSFRLLDVDVEEPRTLLVSVHTREGVRSEPIPLPVMPPDL
jgi:hypothetical protein